MSEVNRDYRFDPVTTGGSTYFMHKGDKVAYLHEPVFPAVDTKIALPDGREATVSGVRLDLSNESQIAMVYVDVNIRTGKGWAL